MFGILNGNIGSIGDIKIKDGKKPFFVLSARDINVMDTAPDADKWVTAFVSGETVEKLAPLRNALKVGHYVNITGRPGANLNVYEGKVSAQKTLATSPGQITLMGAPLGTGKPQAAEATPAVEGTTAAAPAAAAVGAADLDEVGF